MSCGLFLDEEKMRTGGNQALCNFYFCTNKNGEQISNDCSLNGSLFTVYGNYCSGFIEDVFRAAKGARHKTKPNRHLVVSEASVILIAMNGVEAKVVCS